MGRLTAEALGLPTPVYDPTEHYRAVRGKFIGVQHTRRALTPPDGPLGAIRQFRLIAPRSFP